MSSAVDGPPRPVVAASPPPAGLRVALSLAVPSDPLRNPTLTTLVVDVRGLAPLAARATPDRAIATIHGVFARLGTAIEAERGAVHGVLGNCLLAVFAEEDHDGDHPTAAARAALEIRALFETPRGPREFRAGLGLNTGTVVAGRVGPSADAAYAVVGHAVTVASRLGVRADPGQILVGAGTAALLSVEFDVRDRGMVDLAGVGPTAVFELVR